MMLRKNKEECHFEYDMNPYESFMRNHLKHYGYYSGKNQTYRTGKVYEDWQKNHDYPISDQSETEYENQALEDDKSDQDYRPGEDEKKSTQITYSYQAGKMVPKLREPRNLYALNKEYGPQQAPRWPAEMEVLPDRIFHVSVVPNFEEPFYVPTGLEKTPHHPTDGDGKVVYYNPPTKEAYFLRSRVGGSKHSCPFRGIKLKSEEDTTLLFESRFESGNLMKATKVGEYEYNLLLRYDMYTNKHTQWFYFQVKNVKPGVRYRFTITNFLKSGSLYNMGMKPLMYSEKDAETKGRGWRRIGQDIKYYKNNIQRTDLKGEKYFYSLTWTCVFQNADDTCYLAHCYPYTYSHLQDYLLNLSNDPVKNKFCKVRVLCRSLAGNCVYILTITSPSKHPSDAKTKKAVVLTARVHPGETNSSWMMKGFLDYLTGNSADAKLLRDTFVFKIVPMLNPDGVIVGNYRCSLSGRDLNRNYKSILKDSFPSVAHTKNMIKKLQDEREIIMYCDLHGHSRKQNVFIYGCDNKRIASRRLRERIFPVILGRNAPEKFNYNSCKFKVQKSKEGTGRVVIWQMGILNSFTMEATFCGSSLGSRSKTHFNTKDFEAMGYHFCDSLLDLCDPDISKYEQILDELKEKMRQEILAHLQRTGSPMPENGIVNLSDDYTSAIESSTSGSDSSVDDGLPVHLLALAPKLSKKKKLRSRKERDKKRKSLEKAAEKLAKEKAGENAKDSKEKTTPTSKTDKKKDKTMRYRHTDRLSSAGKRSITPGRNDGVPMFVQERCEERQLKKTEYLEAITNAYLMSGVLPPAAQDQSTFHYSQGNHGLTATGVPLGHVEGVCPHHEKAFAEHYVANQLADLQFADEKFDWTHSVVDTRKSVQSLSHRAPSPFQNRPYNKQISMSMVPNEKVVPIGQPQMTGRRSGSPLKRQPMLTDDSQNYAEVITKAFTAKPLTRSRCPSATNIHVYNGRTNSGKPQLMTRSSSKQLLRGNSHYIERTETPMQGPRPSSSIEQTSYVEMNQLVKSTTSQTNITNASKASSETPQFNITNQFGGTVPSHSTVTTSIPRPTVIQTVEQQPNTIHQADGRISSLSSSEQSTTKQEDKPSLRTTAVKAHRCNTESTPISDPSTFSFKYKTANSSHHFSNAQNFYGNAVIMQNSKGTVQYEGQPTMKFVKRDGSGSSSAMSLRSSGSSDLRSDGPRPKSNPDPAISSTDKRTNASNDDDQDEVSLQKIDENTQKKPTDSKLNSDSTPSGFKSENDKPQVHSDKAGLNVNYNNVNNLTENRNVRIVSDERSIPYNHARHVQNKQQYLYQGNVKSDAENMFVEKPQQCMNIFRKSDNSPSIEIENKTLGSLYQPESVSPTNIGRTVEYNHLLDNKHQLNDRFLIARNPRQYFNVSRLELQGKLSRNSMDDTMLSAMNNQNIIPEIEGRALITPREHSFHSMRSNHSPRLSSSVPSLSNRGGVESMLKYQVNHSLSTSHKKLNNQLEVEVNKPPVLKTTDVGGIRSQMQNGDVASVTQNPREVSKITSPSLITSQFESYPVAVMKANLQEKQAVKKGIGTSSNRTLRFKEPAVASVAFSNPPFIYSVQQNGSVASNSFKRSSQRSTFWKK